MFRVLFAPYTYLYEYQVVAGRLWWGHKNRGFRARKVCDRITALAVFKKSMQAQYAG